MASTVCCFCMCFSQGAERTHCSPLWSESRRPQGQRKPSGSCWWTEWGHRWCWKTNRGNGWNTQTIMMPLRQFAELQFILLIHIFMLFTSLMHLWLKIYSGKETFQNQTTVTLLLLLLLSKTLLLLSSFQGKMTVTTCFNSWPSHPLALGSQ